MAVALAVSLSFAFLAPVVVAGDIANGVGIFMYYSCLPLPLLCQRCVSDGTTVSKEVVDVKKREDLLFQNHPVPTCLLNTYHVCFAPAPIRHALVVRLCHN